MSMNTIHEGRKQKDITQLNDEKKINYYMHCKYHIILITNLFVGGTQS